jgi:hypothetical protein
MERSQANLENDTLQFLPLALVFPSAVACFIIFNLPGPNFSHQVEKHLQMPITPLVYDNTKNLRTVLKLQTERGEKLEKIISASLVKVNEHSSIHA